MFSFLAKFLKLAEKPWLSFSEKPELFLTLRAPPTTDLDLLTLMKRMSYF